jgi:small subunit ribosomal protein S9
MSETETETETPAETSVETPAETPVETAVETAVETPAEPVVTETPEPVVETFVPSPQITPLNPIWTVGRRKAATARIRMFPGGGNFIVNGKPMTEFFRLVAHQKACIAPLALCGVTDQVDVRVNVHGGGITGQSGAILMGVARALSQLRPDLEAQLRGAAFMTRDARVVERKKYGRRGARRGFQFSKR